MNKERLIGLAVILLIVGGVLLVRNRGRQKLEEVVPAGQAEIEGEVSELAKQMGVVLPEDTDKIELKDVTGREGRGVATRKFSEGVFTHSVLAALPDPEVGTWYEGWLVRPDPFAVVYTGKLKMAKGGWVVDFVSNQNLLDHKQVVVTLEKVDDRKPESHILEGSF